MQLKCENTFKGTVTQIGNMIFIYGNTNKIRNFCISNTTYCQDVTSPKVFVIIFI